MGYEFRYVTTPPTPAQWQQVMHCFEQAIPLQRIPIARPGSQLKLEAAYAYQQPLRLDWPDDIYVCVNNQGFYLLFHTSNTLEARIIECLTTCLVAAGLTGCFEEL